MPLTPTARRRLVAPVLVLVLASGGCGAAAPSPSGSTPSTTSVPSPSATASPSVPADGVPLTDLGFEHAPAGLSIPAGSQISTASDQAQTVTFVITSPDTAELATYFRTALPAAGFTVTAQATQGSDVTLTFSGRGWQGTFTGTGSLTGVTLMRSP